MGDGTDCSDPNTCTPPTGACCTSNQCNVMAQSRLRRTRRLVAGRARTCDSPASCPAHCGSADFNCDGDTGTDADIEAFFTCLSGNCPPMPCISTADFNGDGDIGTDADIEAFFRVLGGGAC